MSYEPHAHPIQVAVLRQLLFSPELGFADMQKLSDVTSDHFTFHVKKLIEEALKGQKVVLIENEFGEIGIDGGFLKESGIQINEMNSGCICCSLVGDFNTALKDVLEQYTPDRIIIEPDAEQPDEFIPVTESVEGITDESSKLDLVKAAGIVGMGGAGFPTGVKLNINLEETPMGELDPEINPELPKDFKLDCGYILVNAAECEQIGRAHV
mgnify:CR=1 FL=1